MILFFSPMSTILIYSLSCLLQCVFVCFLRLLCGWWTGGFPCGSQSEGGKHRCWGAYGDGRPAVWDEGEGPAMNASELVCLLTSSLHVYPPHWPLSVPAGGVWGFSWTLYYCDSDWSCYQSDGTRLLCKYSWNTNNNKSRDIKASKITAAEVNTKDKGPFAPFNHAPLDNEHYTPLSHLNIKPLKNSICSTVSWVQFWISLLDHHG